MEIDEILRNYGKVKTKFDRPKVIYIQDNHVSKTAQLNTFRALKQMRNIIEGNILVATEMCKRKLNFEKVENLEKLLEKGKISSHEALSAIKFDVLHLEKVSLFEKGLNDVINKFLNFKYFLKLYSSMKRCEVYRKIEKRKYYNNFKKKSYRMVNKVVKKLKSYGVVFLIAGAAHREFIEYKLKKKGIGYITFLPKGVGSYYVVKNKKV